MTIKAENITHLYNKGLSYETKALDGVSFCIEDGSFAGIIGHTGSGKTSLLQILDGLIRPDGGTVEISGTDINADGVSKRKIRSHIGLVFQYPEYQLFEETVEKDVAYGPRNSGLSEAEVLERVKKALSLVGLDYEEVKDMSPFELSGGQKRRAAIAGVLAMEPDVLILDEPAAGLDPKTHKEILETVKQIHDETGNITIMVSHDMEDIARLSDTVLVMDSGRLVKSGTPQEVFADEKALNAIGLAVPSVTHLMNSLRERGVHINCEGFETEQAIDGIYGYIKGKKDV